MKRTKINIKLENYSYDALRELNKMVCNQLNLLQNQQGLEIARKLKIGMTVIYNGKGTDSGEEFIIKKINRTRANCVRKSDNRGYSYNIPFNLLELK